jgi:ornithine cyclodeaminase
MSLSAEQTAQLLPYPALAQALRAVLLDDEAQVPPRRIMDMPGGGKFFVMPAVCAEVAMTKLITFVADNPQHGRPTIQGDVLVFDPKTGTRRAILHGPTVTARRTAAVSLLAAQVLGVRGEGPMLIVGAGVQGHSHLEAFAQGLGVTEFWVASRSRASADALVAHASSLGLRARREDDADAAMADCPMVVSCTSAQVVALRATPREGAFVSAVGAFTPQMVEWAPEVCRALAEQGRLCVDTADAVHEAGDFLQAGLDVATMPTLADIVRQRAQWPEPSRRGATLFKNCGWAGWDLAAALCAQRSLDGGVGPGR